MNWDDLRHLLALAREGSLTRAARALRADATTVRRRVDALERDLGAVLVINAGRDWTLTPEGERVVAAANQAEAALKEVSRGVRGSASEPSGVVRLTTVEILATRLVAPRLRSLRARCPALRVDLLCTTRTLDLQRGEADLALRLVRPSQAGLRVRRLAEVAERPYASRRWLAAHGLNPATLSTLAGLDVALLMGPGDRRWCEGLGEPRVALRSTSASALYAAVQGGLGVGMLVDVLAAGDPELVPLPGLGVEHTRPLWLACPEDLAGLARVRAVIDFLAEEVPAMAKSLSPDGAAGPGPVSGSAQIAAPK